MTQFGRVMKELKKILCVRTKRTLRNDAVIRHNNRFYQVEALLRRRIKAVMVEDRLDGSMHIRNNGQYLKYSEIAPGFIRRSDGDRKLIDRPRKIYIPPKDHPWRRFKLKGSLPSNSYQQKQHALKKEEELN
ncbi:hypothetical protein B9J77_00950 [candidate division NPL-UPA2 bacterium Unc8]|uniref:Uncharacterized protein n=1 Tax=candidate division NPL-UPA2 bacterium Unc8 TaxID=1980939 RepID=A0A399G0T7_UNCN2|nr:MAG: hypothetical protein B9J77_00950 [candidate division NPL-UPA2 bacterium Unc8]